MIGLLLFVVFWCCSTTTPALVSSPGREDGNSLKKIILQVDTASYYEDDYKTFLQRLNEQYQTNFGTTVPDDSIRSWSEQFVEHALLYTGALQQDHRNNTHIDFDVARVARFILLQRGGLLYTKLIKQQVRVTPATVEEAKQHLDTLCEVEYVMFNSKEELRRILGNDTSINTTEDFQRAVQQCSNYPEIIHHTMTWSWLSDSFVLLRDSIYALQEGRPSQFLVDGKKRLMLIVNKRMAAPYYVSQDTGFEKAIIPAIAYIEEKRLSDKFDDDIYSAAQLQINDDTIQQIWSRINNTTITFFDTTQFKDCTNHIIMSYYIDTSLVRVTVGDFMNFYNNRVMRDFITQKIQLYDLLYDIAWEENAMLFVKRHSIDKDSNYVRRRMLYKQLLVVDYFLKHNMHHHSTDEELRAIYKKSLMRFNDGEYAIINIYTFSEFRDAIMGRLMLMNLIDKGDSITELDKSSLKGLVKAEMHARLHYRDTRFNKKTMASIFDLKEKYVLPPIQTIDSVYVVIQKEGIEGERFKDFENVKEILRAENEAEELRQIKNEVRKDLLKKFKIIVYGDLQRYIGNELK